MKLKKKPLGGCGNRGGDRWKAALPIEAGFLAGAILLITLVRSIGAPGLQLGPFTNILGSAYINLTITNGIATNTYQVETRSQFLTNVAWIAATNGSVGQTNFLIPVGPEMTMFYRVLDCDDCDRDGIPNHMDGDPLDASVGILTIFIESPTNNATIY